MIYIIRHGQTALNHAKVLQGRSEQPLNETGIRQAEEAGRKLAEMGITFDRVISSPLGRAIHTAELVAPGITPEIDPRLIEMDYGPYEGADLNDPPEEIITFFQDFVHNPAPEGMEQLASVTARAGSLLEEIRDMEGNILLSTHAIAMKGALEYLSPDSNGSYWSKYITNCNVYAVDNSGGRFGEPKEILRQE